VLVDGEVGVELVAVLARRRPAVRCRQVDVESASSSR
jgi:hypothetical protein